jgi:pentatricopeptide repeat protein
MNDTSIRMKMRAHEVLHEMKKNGETNIRQRPNFISYTVVMNGWAQKGNHEKVSDVLRLMYDDYIRGNKSCKPDVRCYNALMLAYARCNDRDSWTRAEALIEHMQKISNDGVLDVPPDVYTMSTGTCMLGIVMYVDTSIPSSFLTPGISTALSCLANAKYDLIDAATNAEEILNGMRRSYQDGNTRLQPNTICYNSALDAWANAGDPLKTETLFLQMCNDVQRGNVAAKPRTSTYNSKFHIVP